MNEEIITKKLKNCTLIFSIEPFNNRFFFYYKRIDGKDTIKSNSLWSTRSFKTINDTKKMINWIINTEAYLLFEKLSKDNEVEIDKIRKKLNIK